LLKLGTKRFFHVVEHSVQLENGTLRLVLLKSALKKMLVWRLRVADHVVRIELMAAAFAPDRAPAVKRSLYRPLGLLLFTHLPPPFETLLSLPQQTDVLSLELLK
jgi:hypothetical protein